MRNLLAKFNRRRIFFGLIFGFLCSFATFGAYFLLRNNISGGEKAGYALAASVIPTILLAIGFYALSTYMDGKKKERKGIRVNYRDDDRKYFLIAAGLQFAGWIPMFLAYYPGIFAYDVAGQIPQTAGTYTTWHPLLHTLMLKLFYNILGNSVFHNVNTGMALCAVVQMAAMAMMFAYMHLFFRRVSLSKVTRILLLIFCMFVPFVSVMAVSFTKDVLFSGFFLTVLVFLCYGELDRSYFDQWNTRIAFVACTAGMILFRNTGVYVWALFTLIAGVIMLIRKTWRMALLFVMALAAGLLMNAGLKVSLKATDPQANEAYSVPFQQIARVYNVCGNQLGDDMKKEIEDLIPLAGNYYEYSADNIKLETKSVSQYKDRYLRVYKELIKEYPGEMVKAVLFNTQGYWYIFDKSACHVYNGHNEPGFGYFLTFTADGFGVETKSLLPGLRALNERLFEYDRYEYQNIIPLFLLCSMGLYFWLLVFGVLMAWCRKSRMAALPLFYVFLLVLTVFCGPCVLIRYAFTYMICVPLILKMASA